MNKFPSILKKYSAVFAFIVSLSPVGMAQDTSLEKRVENLENGIREIKELLQAPKQQSSPSESTTSPSQSATAAQSSKNIDPVNLAKGAMMEIWKVDRGFNKDTPTGLAAGVFIDKSNVMKLTNFGSRKDLKNFLDSFFAVKWTGLIKVETSGDHAAILEAYTDRDPAGSFTSHVFLRINGELILSMSDAKNNTFLRKSAIDTNTINLEPGFHKVEIFAYVGRCNDPALSLISYKFSLRPQGKATAKSYPPAEMFYIK